ncbi:MAG: 7TM-DISM domain-containing protein, partial [Leptospiraceae bacterium]|nr:7TM-DISM domain-containing protein [Leptospiraceae bacterium]
IQLVQAGQVNGLDSKLDSELDGTWEHCWYVRFTDPGSLEPNLDSGWKPATVPGYLTDIEGYNQDVDEIWYLKEFRIQGELSHSLSLRLGRIDDRDRVYLNGALIGSSGQWDSSVASAYDRIRIYEIPAGLLHKDRPNTILVHVQGYFPGINGMVRGRTEIGPSSELARTLRDEDYGELIFLTGYFTAGSYFLFLFLRRRQNRENLLFALFIYGFVLRQLIRTELRFETDISFLTFKRLEFVLTYLLFVVFLYFVRTYFDYRKNLTTTISDALSAAISGIMVILSVHVLFSDDMRNWWTLQKYVGQPLWLVMLLQVIFLQIRAARQENRDALYMLGGMFFVMIGFFSDLAVSNGYLNIPPLFSYFFAAFIFSLALILANRFVRLYRTVEDLNKNLERKVQDRTERPVSAEVVASTYS